MSKKKMLLIGSIAGVVLAGGGAAFLLLRPAAPAEGAKKVAHADPPAILGLDTFLVNISDPRGDRFARVTLQLTVAPSALAEHAKEDPVLMARMRDRILTLLTAKTAEELNGAMGKEALRREIKAQLDPLLEHGAIEDVLFAEFVVQ
jgi:flagellar FliL protein